MIRMAFSRDSKYQPVKEHATVPNMVNFHDRDPGVSLPSKLVSLSQRIKCRGEQILRELKQTPPEERHLNDIKPKDFQENVIPAWLIPKDQGHYKVLQGR